MRVRLAVFDMVGTTVHVGDAVPSAFRDAFRSIGLTLSEEELVEIRGRSKAEGISRLLIGHGAREEEVAERTLEVLRRFQHFLRRAFHSNLHPVPEAESVFRFLEKRAVSVVLTTGLDRESAKLLVHTLAWDRIGMVGFITADDVAQGRPAPNLIRAAMRMAGVPDRGAVLAVGDTVADLDAAAAAGVGWSLGVLTGAHSRGRLEAVPHSAILESVGGIPRWLSNVGGFR